MNEHVSTLKSTAKGKDKTSALTGLLNAGKTDFKNSDKTAFEKLLTAAKKTGIEVVDKNSSKIKNSENQAHTQDSKIDESTMASIKQLLSSIKLNDKLAIEKSVKELRDVAENTKNPKTSKELKKLLALAEKADVNVQKISVEKIKDGEQTESKQQTKQKIAESDAKLKLLEQTKSSQAQTQDTKNTLDMQAGQAKAVKQQTLEQKETPNLATLLQKDFKSENKKTEDRPQATNDDQKLVKTATKELAKESVQTQNGILKKKEEPKQSTKEIVQNAFKNEIKENPEGNTVKPIELADLLKKEAPKETKENSKEVLNSLLADTQKTVESDLKSKMAVAKEGLKNFSEDLKETIDNYKPPLMKVSMEMKPENLGSVDVTLITRGQNLVVNVSSNQDTMQMFMQNLPEFKANLMAQGFVSLQMNFNFSENKDQSNKNWQKEAAKKYQINNDTKTNNTIESLDIIMPHPKYA